MTATALEWSGGRARLPSARIPFYLLLLGFPDLVGARRLGLHVAAPRDSARVCTAHAG